MQRIQTVTNKRPRRAEQVVPIEPALSGKRWFAISGAVVLVLYAVNAYFTLNTELWGHACLDSWGFFYVISTTIALFSPSPKKALNQRRQQAARYNLAVGIAARAAAEPQPETSELPDAFAICFQRRWLGTLIVTIVGILTVGVIGLTVYGYWQIAPQAVQHGVPLFVTIFQNGMNIALLLLAVIGFVRLLVIPPSQQLIATREGLTYRERGSTRFIPWQEARLFAVVAEQETRKYGQVLLYELASKETTIRWLSSSGSIKGISHKATLNANILARPLPSPADFPRQVQFLNIIIAERTGLQLYDLC